MVHLSSLPCATSVVRNAPFRGHRDYSLQSTGPAEEVGVRSLEKGLCGRPSTIVRLAAQRAPASRVQRLFRHDCTAPVSIAGGHRSGCFPKASLARRRDCVRVSEPGPPSGALAELSYVIASARCEEPLEGIASPDREIPEVTDLAGQAVIASLHSQLIEPIAQLFDNWQVIARPRDILQSVASHLLTEVRSVSSKMGACNQFAVIFLVSALVFGDVASAAVSKNDVYIRAGTRPDVPIEVGRVDSDEPQQVHVSMAGPHKVKVTWLTSDHNSPSTVQFGESPGNYDRLATGESLSYNFITYRSGLIHHVTLGTDSPLKDNWTYYYRCANRSQEFSFKTPPPDGPDVPITFSVIGDLGQTGWSSSTLQHMAASSHDMVILAGDLSYADSYQPRWDSWGRLIQPLASSRPWMVVEGNHEIEGLLLEPKFKAYNARWPMPYAESDSPSNLFYSFDVAGVHWLMLGSYADYEIGSAQYKWLQADLAKVDRSITPWLITVLHAPWYNSNEVHQGEGAGMMAAMEDLLYQAQVDILFAGHVHAYERSERVYHEKVNPCGIMHITIGDGGNREGLASTYLDPQPEWSVKREASFGHGELEILNATTARWSWHRNQDDEAVVADELTVTSLSAPGGLKCKAPGVQRTLGRKERIAVPAN